MSTINTIHRITMSDILKNSMDDQLVTCSHKKTKIDIDVKDSETGEILFSRRNLHNKVILPGAAFTARKHFNIGHNEITPSYNTVLGLDDSVNETPDPYDIEKCYLFSVGVDGGGHEPSQVYPVNYNKWCDPKDLVPFRYQPINQDIDESLKDTYFGKKTYESQKRIAYYFKAFDAEPTFHQQFEDGTPITSDVYDSLKTDEIETYVELKLKITKEDCREWFSATTGPNTARINTISLLTGWAKTIDGHTVYQDIRPLTKLNFPLESLIDLTKSIEITYHIYY